MTRDEVRNIFEGATDEQIKALLDINSADIGKAKKESETLGDELSAAKAKLTAYEDKIKGLENSLKDTEVLQSTIDELKADIEARKTAETEAAENKALNDRFLKVIGDKEFINAFTQSGIFEEFKAAIRSEDNAGRADADIYADITRDRDNLFVPKDGLPSVSSTSGGFGTPPDDADVREIMGLPPIK